MKENVDRGAHALTGLMSAPSVIMFLITEQQDLFCFPAIFFTFAFHYDISK